MKFTPELIEKAKTAKSVEELMALTRANGVAITEEEAKEYFARLSPYYGEIDDDELDNVSGGACENYDEDIEEKRKNSLKNRDRDSSSFPAAKNLIS